MGRTAFLTEVNIPKYCGIFSRQVGPKRFFGYTAFSPLRGEPEQAVQIISHVNLAGQSRPLPSGKKIVVVEPHTDDACFEMDMTIRRLAQKNEIVLVNAISDHLGVLSSQAATKAAKKALREKEGKAYALLFAGRVTYLPLRMDFPFIKMKKVYGASREYHNSYETTHGQPQTEDFVRFAAALRDLDPDMLFVPYPLDHHQMHRDVSQLSVYAAHLLALGPDSRERQFYFYSTMSSLYARVVMEPFYHMVNLANFYSLDGLSQKLSDMQVYRSQHQRIQLLKRHPYTIAVPANDFANGNVMRAFLRKTAMRDKFSEPYAETFVGFRPQLLDIAPEKHAMEIPQELAFDEMAQYGTF